MSISPAHQDRLVAQGRDEMMTAFLKAQERAPNEAQQRAASERFTAFMQEIIPQIVGVVAAGDYPAFAVKLENIDGKGKIALKATDVDKAGPALITRLGSTLTLVLADAEQFDMDRPAANIQPDQRVLPGVVKDEADEEFAEEMGEIAEDVAEPNFDDQGLKDTENGEHAGPLFTAVEDEPCTLPGGEVIRPWTIVHGSTGLEVFVPVDAEAFVAAATDKLNALAAEIERDPTPFEVRNSILGVLHASQENIGIAFHAPYSAEVEQDNAAPVEEPAKRGPKSAAAKADACNAGWDAAAAGKPATECPHAKGVLKDHWFHGYQLHEKGSPRPFIVGDTDRTPKEQGRAAFAAGAAYLDGQPADMSFPDVGQWREGWKEAEAAAQVEQQPAANDDGAEPRESTGNVAA